MKPRLYLLLLLALSLYATMAYGGNEPNPDVRLDLTRNPTISHLHIRLFFLTDDTLLISSGETPVSTFIFDLSHEKMLRTAVLGNAKVSDTWPTHDGKFVIRSADDHLVVYDKGLVEVGRVRIPQAEGQTPNVQVSPDGSRISLSWLLPPKSAKTIVFDADNLVQIAEENTPADPKLAAIGLVYENSYLLGGDGSVHLRRFKGIEDQLLFSGKPKCFSSASILNSEQVLLANCSHKVPYVVNFAGQLNFELPGGETFLQTSTSGKSFALGIQQYSRTHFLKNLNLLAVLAGTEEYAENFVLRAYASTSGKLVMELKWKLNKDEPMFNRYDNSILALSPNGQLLATIRGKWLEVYRLPSS